MRYIRYIANNYNQDIMTDIDIAIFKLLDIEEIQTYIEDSYVIYLAYLKNSVDISQLEKKYNFIQELSEADFLCTMDKLDIHHKTIVDQDGYIKKISHKEYYDKFILDGKPFLGAEWDQLSETWKYMPESLNEFLYDKIKINNKIYWKIKNNQNRFERIYYLWLIDDNSDGKNTYEDVTLKSLETITNKNKNIENLFLIDNKLDYTKFDNYDIVLDLYPLAYVTYHSDNKYLDQIKNCLKPHPHTGARTIYELIRLILEWSYSHIYMSNSEPTAKLCYNLVNCININKNIYESILKEIKPQSVEKYLLKDEQALVEDTDDPNISDELLKWFSELYFRFYPRQHAYYTNVNVDKLQQL